MTADDAPIPGEPDWWYEFDGGQSYLIDAEHGECVGIGVVHSDVFFGSLG
ncbi:hypothetical protein LK533_07525 [Sphingomonas sp. PL-96]|nr:hypothetical protein [Sphingomonas sp. PL-96]MCC2976523.1 hypothetical protein [Sphingomonas sp. PL-96]